MEFDFSKIKRIYLAGKMGGLPQMGHPGFHKATMHLRDQGFEVMNPAETDGGDTTKPRAYYMGIDLNYVINEADAVVVMDNWKNSPGAKLEVRTALEIDKPVLNLSTMEPITERVEIVVSDYVIR